MLVFLSIVSLGLLGMIIYFAFAPDSGRQLRLVAIIALGAITIALFVCGILIIKGPGEQVDGMPFPNPFVDSGQQAGGGVRVMDLLIFLGIMAIMALILFKAYRDQQKIAKPEKKAAASSIFSKKDADTGDDLDDLGLDNTSFDDESFDLGLD
jgi:hypothetical protein